MSMENQARRMLNVRHWLDPELFVPFLLGSFFCLTCSEFVRGALTLSLLPTYGRGVLGFAVEWTALALSAQYIMDNLLRAPSGWIIDKLGPRYILIIGFVIATASVFFMMRAHSIVTLIIALAIYGAGVTPVWPVAISCIHASTPEEKRASFMGYMYVFWMIGTGLGPVVINFFTYGTYRMAFWILFFVEGLGLLIAIALVRPKEDPAAFRVRPVDRLKTNWPDVLRNVKEVAFLFPGMFAQTFAVSSLMPILSIYVKSVLHISGALYSGLLLTGGALAIAFLLPAGKLVDRFGSRLFLVPGFLVAGSLLFFLPLTKVHLLVFLVVGLLGTTYAFILPAWNAVLDHKIDKDKKAMLWGVFMTVEGIGAAAGPYFGGLLWDKISVRAPFFGSAMVIAAMGVLYLFLPIGGRKRKRKSSAPRASSLTQLLHIRGKSKTKTKT